MGYGRVDGWRGVRVDGYVNGWIRGWMDTGMDRYVDGWLNIQIYSSVNEICDYMV
jgi:hypothetical protein